jgi:hypothetical protein
MQDDADFSDNESASERRGADGIDACGMNGNIYTCQLLPIGMVYIDDLVITGSTQQLIAS